MRQPDYQRGGISLWRGDCLEILPELEAGDHVITDPPYSDHVHKKQWIGAALTANGAPRVSTAFKELGFDALTPDVALTACREFQRLCSGWSLVCADLEGLQLWRECAAEAGLEYVRACVWDKVDSAPQFTGDRPANSAELIICLHRPGRKRWNGGGRRNVFRHAVNEERGAKPHPSTKPVPLMLELVELFTNPGDLVLDPFCGSGSTAVACVKTGRRCWGIEIDERYFRVAVERVEAAFEETALLDYTAAAPEQLEGLG